MQARNQSWAPHSSHDNALDVPVAISQLLQPAHVPRLAIQRRSSRLQALRGSKRPQQGAADGWKPQDSISTSDATRTAAGNPLQAAARTLYRAVPTTTAAFRALSTPQQVGFLAASAFALLSAINAGRRLLNQSGGGGGAGDAIRRVPCLRSCLADSISTSCTLADCRLRQSIVNSAA